MRKLNRKELDFLKEKCLDKNLSPEKIMLMYYSEFGEVSYSDLFCNIQINRIKMNAANEQKIDKEKEIAFYELCILNNSLKDVLIKWKELGYDYIDVDKKFYEAIDPYYIQNGDVVNIPKNELVGIFKKLQKGSKLASICNFHGYTPKQLFMAFRATRKPLNRYNIIEESIIAKCLRESDTNESLKDLAYKRLLDYWEEYNLPVRSKNEIAKIIRHSIIPYYTKAINDNEIENVISAKEIENKYGLTESCLKELEEDGLIKRMFKTAYVVAYDKKTVEQTVANLKALAKAAIK